MAQRGTVVPGEGTEFREEHPEKRGALQGFVEGTLSSSFRLVALVIFCLFPLLAYVWVDLPPRAHIVLSIMLVAAGLLVTRRTPQLRLMIVFISLAASLRYILYRGTETLALRDWGDTIVSILLFGAEVYALITLVGGYFQTAIIRRNRPLPLDLPPDELPSVDVYIPTYNEPVEVLRPTVLGALAMDYPNKTVYVLDDGRRPEVRRMAESLGAKYIDRPDNFGAKAGNINNALKQTNGALIAFFDADHIPVRSFLSATVGFFLENERLALVQTPHHFYNPDPFIRNLYLEGRVPPEQHLFYHGIQLGNDFWNSAFFCGSCAVIRRQSLDEVGGLSHQTVTEDAHTALQLHARGWDSLYLDIPLAAGLATETYAQHVGQRIRWARGMAQIVRLDNPLFKQGLSLAQRLNYFNAAWHFFNGLPRLIFVVTPALYLLFNLHPVDADVREVLVYAIPHLVLVALGAVTVHRNVRHSLWPEVYEVAIAPYTALVTMMAVIMPRRGKFNVTAKGTQVDKRTFDLRHAFPLLIILALLIAAVVVLPSKLANNPLDSFTIWVAAAWNFYNIIVLSAAVLSALERPQRRRYHRIDRRSRVLVSPWEGAAAGPYGFEPIEGDTVDLSQGGLSFELPGDRQLPAGFGVTLISPYGRTSVLPATGLSREATRDGTRFRARFDDLTAAQHVELSKQLFSDSNAWIGDRFSYDRYLRSVGSVVLAIPAALLGNPAWLRRLREERRTERAPLIPGSDLHDCHACGAVMLEGATACEACGALVPYDTHASARPAPLTRPEPQPGVLPLVMPLTLVVIASLLAVGWSPVVRAFSEFMPMQRWERVTYQTRLGELARAWYAIDGLRDELVAAVAAGRPVPPDWSNRLWSIQRDYTLFQGVEKQPEVIEIHRKLSEAVLQLADAEKLYRSQEQGGASPEVRAERRSEIVSYRLQTVDTQLAAAAEELRLP